VVLHAVGLAIGYFVFGIIIAAINQELTTFLKSRIVYVLLVAVIACVTSACWYPRALIEVIAVTPESFKVEPVTVLKIVKDWMKLIRLPITLTYCGPAFLQKQSGPHCRGRSQRSSGLINDCHLHVENGPFEPLALLP
jgi:hypothetical protein